MCDIEKIEKEIDIETNLNTEEYLPTSIQDDPSEYAYDLTADIEMDDYNSVKKATERFLGEI